MLRSVFDLRPHRPPDMMLTPPRGAASMNAWRRGREAEGGGLLNRYTLSRRIEGSNPSGSAIPDRRQIYSGQVRGAAFQGFWTQN